MNPINDPALCQEMRSLMKPAMLSEAYMEGEFNIDWIKKRGWYVVPVERAQHFISEEIHNIVTALRKDGFTSCFALASEPLDPYPMCYELAITEEGLNEFNRECGLFRFVLIDTRLRWAISCTEAYNLFAGPQELVESMIGKSIKEAWKAYWELIEKAGEDPNDLLYDSVKRYAALAI